VLGRSHEGNDRRQGDTTCGWSSASSSVSTVWPERREAPNVAAARRHDRRKTAVQRLREKVGGDVQVMGSLGPARALISNDLVDEYELMVARSGALEPLRPAA
jgi:hypothetical protein